MARLCGWILVLAGLLVSACDDPKPAMSGRLRGPSSIVAYKACPQDLPGCDRVTDGHHLLLVVNSMANDVRIFDTEKRSFFEAINPLFPFSIPVGPYPRALAVDPFGEFGFVVNSLSEDVSVINLAPNRLVEVDTDDDPSTAAASLGCPDEADQTTDPTSDRCLAGVSRAGLGPDGPLQPEQIAVPAGLGEPPWDRTQPLPVWVSLPAVGRLGLLHFSYPGLASRQQRLDLIDLVDVGGMPSGMALTRDGGLLFVADEMSDSIVAIDTATSVIERIEIGGPTRRVFLTPDESALYVVRLDVNLIALVDVETRQRIPAGIGDRPESLDPEGSGFDIQLPGIPREIAFVHGRPIPVAGTDGQPEAYPLDGEARDLFAYVSDLNGNVYILDAVEHRTIDVQPLVGPSSGTPGYAPFSKVVDADELNACVDSGTCPYPHLADYDRIFDGVNETEPVFYGIWTTAGQTRTEGWILTYEGVLPGTGFSTTGSFNGLNLEDSRMGLDFNVSEVLPDDILEITSPPAPNPDGTGTVHPACIPDGKEEVRFGLRVDFVRDSNTLAVVNVPGMDFGLCWPEAVNYKVRPRGAWTVVGLGSGPQERLVMTRCDPALPPPEPVYDNGLIALTMCEPEPDLEGNIPEVPRDATWGFTTDDGFLHALFAPSIRAGLAGPLVPVDLDDGADQEREVDDPLEGPADDRVFLLFEASNALMEFFPESLESTNYVLYQ